MLTLGALAAAQTGQIQPFKLPRLPIAPLTGAQSQPPQQAETQPQSQAAMKSMAGSASLFNNVKGFLRIEGIPGPSTDNRYVGWIDVLSFTDGINAPGSGARQGVAASGFRALTVTKPIDSASVPLRRAAAAGLHLQRVDLALTGGGRNLELYRVNLEDAVITRVDTSMRDGVASEELDVAFARIRWQFTLWGVSGQNQGTLNGCWDVGANRAC